MFYIELEWEIYENYLILINKPEIKFADIKINLKERYLFLNSQIIEIDRVIRANKKENYYIIEDYSKSNYIIFEKITFNLLKDTFDLLGNIAVLSKIFGEKRIKDYLVEEFI